jgi:hypothetical protein
MEMSSQLVVSNLLATALNVRELAKSLAKQAKDANSVFTTINASNNTHGTIDS